MNKLFGYEVSDPLVKRLAKNRRKKALLGKVRRVKNAEKKISKLYGDVF